MRWMSVNLIISFLSRKSARVFLLSKTINGFDGRSGRARITNITLLSGFMIKSNAGSSTIIIFLPSVCI